jgi:hypothetical protein
MDNDGVIKSIDSLPEDVVLYEIFPNLMDDVLVGLDRINYAKFHTCLRDKIPSMKYESYIRRTARNDHYFVFEQLLDENFDKWRSMKKYEYRSCVFETYLHFLVQFCMDLDSPRCREAIDRRASSVLGKKWHKNSKIRSSRSSRWTN